MVATSSSRPCGADPFFRRRPCRAPTIRMGRPAHLQIFIYRISPAAIGKRSTGQCVCQPRFAPPGAVIVLAATDCSRELRMPMPDASISARIGYPCGKKELGDAVRHGPLLPSCSQSRRAKSRGGGFWVDPGRTAARREAVTLLSRNRSWYACRPIKIPSVH